MLNHLSFAQSQDYVITNHGDTLKCAIAIDVIDSTAQKYKTAAMTTAKKFRVDEIKEYYIARSSISYRAVYKNGYRDPFYMKVLENGKINLYQFAETGSSPSIYDGHAWATSGNPSVRPFTWYFAQGSEVAMAIKSNEGLGIDKKHTLKAREALGAMLKDKPDIYAQFLATDKLSFFQIRNFIRIYNTGQPFVPEQKKEEKEPPADYNPNSQ